MQISKTQHEANLLHIIIIFCLMAIATACAPMRASPFTDKVETNLTNSNGNTIAFLEQHLTQQSLDDKPLRFALIADSHANFSDLEKTVKLINQQPVDFTVHLGDMTELGLAVEYEAAVGLLGNLHAPWLTVIGNHDAVGHGHYIYKKIFGEFNQSFVLQGYRFILFNNNTLEFGRNGIAFDWLEQQISQSAEPVILFQHADPFNKDNFDAANIQQLERILQLPKLRAVFHGHLHKFNRSYFGNTLIQEIHRTEDSSYALIELQPNSMNVNLCHGVRCENTNMVFTQSHLN